MCLKLIDRKGLDILHSLSNPMFGRFTSKVLSKIHFIIRFNSQNDGTRIGLLQCQMLVRHLQFATIRTDMRLSNAPHSIG